MSYTLGGGGGRKLVTDINVTPFVDIVLVLLVIFMVTATYIVKGGIPVQLPKAGSAGELPAALLVLGVDAKGQYLVKGLAVTDAELASVVRSAVASNPEVEAVIAADTKVAYGRVMELIDTVRGLGVKRFAAEVEKKVGNW
jgi:biopolymer transport protein ExbD